VNTADRPPPSAELAEGAERALRAVLTVLHNRDRADALQESPERTAQELGLPPGHGAKILNILHTVEHARPTDEGRAPEPAGRPEGSDEIRRILLEPFQHIRQTFYVLKGLSVVTFTIGVALLVTALVKAVNESELSAATLTIGGLGLADFTLLFLRRPWQDIARNLSNSQQARIIATSYLAAVSMIDKRDETRHDLLRRTTRDAVELLEEFTEGDGDAPPG
jgi:hypothetical protein